MFQKQRLTHQSRAVITGSGSGIGKALALELARRKGLIVCSDISLQAAEQTAREVRAEGGEAWAVACDVSDLAQVEALAQQAQELLPQPLNLVINNAGIGIGGQKIGDLRHEIHRAAQGAMTASLSPLGNDDRCAQIHGLSHMRDGLTLADQRDIRLCYFCHKRAGIPKGEHDRTGIVGQNQIQQIRILCQRPGDETTTNRRVACISKCLAQKSCIAVTATDQAQPASLTDSLGQLPPAGTRHGGR